MPTQNKTIISEQLLVAFADQLSPYASKINLSADAFTDPSIEFPESKFIELLELAAQTTQSNIGLNIGKETIPAHIGAIGYAFVNANNIEQGLNILSKFIVTYSHYSEITWQKKDHILIINYRISEPTIIRKQQDTEFALSTIFNFLCCHARNFSYPLRVEFAHEKPTDISDHRQLFKCPIRFKSKYNRLIFDANILNSKLKGADSRLFEILECHLEQQKILRETDQFKNTVSQIIANQLSQNKVSINEVSKELKISVRTIQRRLGKLSLDFSTLVDQVRQHLATQHIKNPKLSILQVSELTGYSETSSFIRAFKRWTGKTPNQYRKEE